MKFTLKSLSQRQECGKHLEGGYLPGEERCPVEELEIEGE